MDQFPKKFNNILQIIMLANTNSSLSGSFLFRKGNLPVSVKCINYTMLCLSVSGFHSVGQNIRVLFD